MGAGSKRDFTSGGGRLVLSRGPAGALGQIITGPGVARNNRPSELQAKTYP
jgi:hypothetical protein